VKDIRSGPRGSQPSQLTSAGDHLFFAADDGLSGVELWVSDGSETGTRLVADISGAPSAWPRYLVRFRSEVLFTADDGRGSCGIWKSDGSERGTTPLHEYPYQKDFDRPCELPAEITPAGDEAFFLAGDSRQAQLWKTDGSVDGTTLVKGGAADPGRFSARSLQRFEDVVLFAGTDDDHGTDLWRSDGSPTGTTLVRDIRPGPTGSVPRSLTVAGRKLFFVADGETGPGLWQTDGSGEGTFPLTEMAPGPGPRGSSGLVAVGDLLFFGSQNDLWRSDGTSAGTFRVHSGVAPLYLTALGDVLVFTGFSASLGGELWRSDGTLAGTVPIAAINPGVGSAHPTEMTELNRIVFFAADDGSSGRELWRSDGTAAGTRRVKDLAPGPEGSGPSFLSTAGGLLLFLARVGEREYLWRSDGTEAGTLMLQEVHFSFALGRDHPLDFVQAGPYVFFTQDSLSVGRELWALPLAALAPECVGDCDGNGVVTVDELVVGVSIALGISLADDCRGLDSDGDRRITVDELVAAVGYALTGCE
jgi:ELWxxDGT repeat protein